MCKIQGKTGTAQAQPIDVGLLGSALQEAGDPDWQCMEDFEKGVRIGVGVRLPRTPRVFGRKVRWKFEAQRDPEAHKRDDYAGVTVANYPSAAAFAKEVAEALRDQADRGQIEIVPEAEARRRYGERLATAALGAIEKGKKDDGSTEIRIIRDGTHHVKVNERITAPLPQTSRRPCATWPSRS